MDIDSLFRDSTFHMADISAKAPTFRRALAMGRIIVGKEAFALIKNGKLPKGDVLKLAEIAGVQGAKQASNLIPLCHPLPLDYVNIHLELEQNGTAITVYCMAATTAKTGVEMEALAGVNAALLTIYDLTKPVEPALTITDIRLLMKEGGKKGKWLHPDGMPCNASPESTSKNGMPLSGITASVITLSDRASSGEYEDKSGKILQGELEALGAKVNYHLLPDDMPGLVALLNHLTQSDSTHLVITCGGTGITDRDIAPDSLKLLQGREVPGIGELLRSSGARNVPTSWLSRSIAMVIHDTLVITLPGSPGAVRDGMEALRPILPHALKLTGAIKSVGGDHSGSGA